MFVAVIFTPLLAIEVVGFISSTHKAGRQAVGTPAGEAFRVEDPNTRMGGQRRRGGRVVGWTRDLPRRVLLHARRHRGAGAPPTLLGGSGGARGPRGVAAAFCRRGRIDQSNGPSRHTEDRGELHGTREAAHATFARCAASVRPGPAQGPGRRPGPRPWIHCILEWFELLSHAHEARTGTGASVQLH